MNAEIKFFHSTDVYNLELYQPKKEDDFCILLQVMAGPENKEGEESFDITVCTPNWLINNYNKDDIIIGRHHLIVFKYDWLIIKKTIMDYVNNCTGNDWYECALKLSRLGRWEFEDYK